MWGRGEQAAAWRAGITEPDFWSPGSWEPSWAGSTSLWEAQAARSICPPSGGPSQG